MPRIQGQARRGPAGQIPQQIEEARPEDFRQHQYRTQIQEIAGYNCSQGGQKLIQSHDLGC